MNGFRKMISDRIPQTWDMALRWCAVRSRFIERVYNLEVKPLHSDWRPKKTRMLIASNNVKEALNPKLSTIRQTVGLTRLFSYGSREDYEYWLQVCKWVEWFSAKIIFIKSTIEIAKKNGETDDTIVNTINDRYQLHDLKLAKFILTHLEI